MPNQTSLEQMELAELTQTVDDGRVAADPFKLLAASRTLLDGRLADLKAKDVATLTSEGTRATESANLRAALDQLQKLLRDGYNFIQGLGSFAISDADRLGVFTAYGWESGLVGDFSDARIESLANQAITVTPTIADATHRYPAALLTLIAAQLAIVNTNQPLATGGSAQGATDARDAALALLQLINARVRFFYCNASDDLDQTAELVKIGRQPRSRSRRRATASRRPRPGHVRCRRAEPDRLGPARSRDDPASLPPPRRRHRRTGRHLGHHHRLAHRPRPADPRRHLRVLARRPQLPRRRPAEQPRLASRDVIPHHLARRASEWFAFRRIATAATTRWRVVLSLFGCGVAQGGTEEWLVFITETHSRNARVPID